ncbi:GNAT family N-acetyltransferase [Nonomuraea sp. NPDC059023]|uniref:GNAT family N-acetyltransferase n=1 Tax=unclassified Nonomuraea TaxID=2593643 RepID=UPI00369EEB54
MRLLPFHELTLEQLDTWHGLRAANPALDSPFFHPRFAGAVHASGRAVHVAVGEDALLACHRIGSTLRPAGWPGADFQGPLLVPGTAFEPLRLLGKGVTGFEFDHLVEGVAGFERWTVTRRASPYVEVGGGLDGYLARASKAGKDNMGQARRRAAKAGRELGPVRFAADSLDEDALAQVIELKRAQYRATGARDYFAEPGRTDLLKLLLHTREPDFSGILSTLHAGPHLLAAHFGIRSGGVLHWWFPVYDPGHAKLAPGWILLRELVLAAPSLGVERIDLGRGDDEYKRRAKTGETTVGQGLVTRNPVRRAARTALERVRPTLSRMKRRLT